MDQRMDLEAAGKLLGLHPNSVRARAKKGKLRHETDNAGKIWVWVDADKAANDRPTMNPSKSPVEPSMKVSNQELVAAFEGQIEALKSEATSLRETVTDLRGRLDLSEADRRRLTEALIEKQTAPPPPLPPPVVVERPSLFARLFRSGRQ
jgi:hypothetical protein